MCENGCVLTERLRNVVLTHENRKLTILGQANNISPMRV